MGCHAMLYSMDSDYSDVELVERWRAGDRAAGQIIVRRYHADVAKCFRIGVLDEELQDLIQETFERVIGSEDSIDNEIDLHVRLVETAQRVLRENLSNEPDGGGVDRWRETLPDGRPAGSTYAVTDRRLRRLADCLLSLPPNKQLLLDRYYRRSQTIEQLGEFFEIPNEEVQAHLKNATLEFKQSVQADSGGQGPFAWAVRNDEALERTLRDIGRALMIGVRR